MTTTTQIHHVGLKQGIRDTGIIVKRNAMRNVRLPELVLFATVQPVLFLLLFNYVFGGSIGASLSGAFGGKYVNYLLPGMLVQTDSALIVDSNSDRPHRRSFRRRDRPVPFAANRPLGCSRRPNPGRHDPHLCGDGSTARCGLHHWI